MQLLKDHFYDGFLIPDESFPKTSNLAVQALRTAAKKSRPVVITFDEPSPAALPSATLVMSVAVEVGMTVVSECDHATRVTPYHDQGIFFDAEVALGSEFHQLQHVERILTHHLAQSAITISNNWSSDTIANFSRLAARFVMEVAAPLPTVIDTALALATFVHPDWTTQDEVRSGLVEAVVGDSPFEMSGRLLGHIYRQTTLDRPATSGGQGGLVHLCAGLASITPPGNDRAVYCDVKVAGPRGTGRSKKATNPNDTRIPFDLDRVYSIYLFVAGMASTRQTDGLTYAAHTPTAVAQALVRLEGRGLGVHRVTKGRGSRMLWSCSTRATALLVMAREVGPLVGAFVEGEISSLQIPYNQKGKAG